MPTDVQTAFQLWWGVLGLGLVNLFANLALMYRNRVDYAQQFRHDLLAQDPSATMSQDSAEHILVSGLVVIAVVGVVVVALGVLIDFAMRKGRNWARMLLTLVGSFLVVIAIPAVFGLTVSTPGVAALIVGAASILQAVLAGGSIFLMHRRESNRYFLRFPPPDVR
ncbi:hypothetical protein FOS14_12380 [Skermania sp. ID1734]|nr:hypothetical protein FOS14_12380 [Skermania sp. ID1734]